jgi:integrase
MKLETRKILNGKQKYRYRFMLSGQRYATPWSLTKKIADDAVATIRMQTIANGAPKASVITVADWASEWLVTHVWPNKVPTAAVRDEQALRCYILPKIGTKRLANLRTADVKQLKCDLQISGRLSKKTINNYLGTLKKMLNDAVAHDLLSKNPAKAVALEKIQANECNYLYDDEVARLLGHCKQDYANYFPLVLFAVNTGCRLGECCALKWANVDMAKGMAKIDSTYDAKLRCPVERTKGKRFRVVPLNESVLSELRTLKIARYHQSADLVFAGISYDYVTHELFKRIMAEAGLGDALKRGVTFHSLRHTFASKFMTAQGSLYRLQKILGHSSITQTEKYAHFAGTFLRGETERVNFNVGEGKVVKFGSDCGALTCPVFCPKSKVRS